MLLFLSMKTPVAKPSGSCFCSVVVCGCQTAAQTLTWRVWSFCQRVLAVTRRKSPFCSALLDPRSLVPHMSPVMSCYSLATLGIAVGVTEKQVKAMFFGEMERRALRTDGGRHVSGNRPLLSLGRRKWKAKNTKMFHPVFVQLIYHTAFIVPIVCNSCNILIIAVASVFLKYYVLAFGTVEDTL